MMSFDLNDADAVAALLDELEADRPGFRARLDANLAARRAARNADDPSQQVGQDIDWGKTITDEMAWKR